MPLLNISNLSFRYSSESSPLFDQLNFKVNNAERIVILGESGCGKSTLLRLLYGLLDAESGTIVFKNRHVTGPAYNLLPGVQDMALLHQDYQLMPKISIRENILYPLLNQTKDYSNAMADELLSILNLTEHQYKLPYQLSGGQQQRAAWARALSTKPDLILMDEPFSNLDVALKENLRNELKEIIEALGTSLLMVSHDIDDAFILADRLLIIKEGKIIREGTPQVIYQNPGNSYVASLTGRNTNIPSEWLSANIDPGKQWCIRPENIRLAENGFKVRVTGKRFMGSYQLISLTSASGIVVEMQTETSFAPTSKEIKVGFSEEKIYQY